MGRKDYYYITTSGDKFIAIRKDKNHQRLTSPDTRFDTLRNAIQWVTNIGTNSYQIDPLCHSAEEKRIRAKVNPAPKITMKYPENLVPGDIVVTGQGSTIVIGDITPNPFDEDLILIRTNDGRNWPCHAREFTVKVKEANG